MVFAWVRVSPLDGFVGIALLLCSSTAKALLELPNSTDVKWRRAEKQSTYAKPTKNVNYEKLKENILMVKED